MIADHVLCTQDRAVYRRACTLREGGRVRKMVTVALSGSHSHCKDQSERPSFLGSPLPFCTCLNRVLPHSHSGKEAKAVRPFKGMRRKFWLIERRKERSFLLPLKNSHLRNQEKLPGAGCPKTTKDSHVCGFSGSVFLVFGASVHTFLLLPYIVK